MRQGNSDIEFFPPSRRHAYLDMASVKKLVERVRPGFNHPANLERVGNAWRLRVTFDKPEGGTVRRCITLPDDEAANWVGTYLSEARKAWREEQQQRKKDEREKKNRENQ